MKIPRLAIAQMNPVVGDFAGNYETILGHMHSAADAGIELLVFGELALCGYPLGDLSYRRDFIEHAENALRRILSESKSEKLNNLTVVLGTVGLPDGNSPESQRSYAAAANIAVAFRGGDVLASHQKVLLPNFDVFDDWRNFIPGDGPTFFEMHGLKIGLAICEDIWSSSSKFRREMLAGNPDLIVVPNGSPFTIGKPERRVKVAADFANGVPLLYVNLRGGQDELVFDGGSFLVDARGEMVWRAEDHSALQVCDLQIPATEWPDTNSGIWEALKLGLSDYLMKTGQSRVVLGLSGGIDSALCAALAADAIGAENVLGVRLPSRYSSHHSLEDAEQLARNLKIELRTVSIDDAHSTFESMVELSPLAEENLQARLRAVTLMAISNSENRILLSTGNKSEVAVGYSTIYGDAAGGFAPIKDVYKTRVWDLARWRNNISAVIPQRSIDKPPSAELRPGQTDQDSLPDYKILDQIVEDLVEHSLTVGEIVAKGFDQATVLKTDDLVRKAEWKRSQGAIGTKITAVSFGRGRRVPIATRVRPL